MAVRYRWKFYPQMSRPVPCCGDHNSDIYSQPEDCIPSGAFWIFTIALWSIFASSGSWYCSQALLRSELTLRD